MYMIPKTLKNVLMSMGAMACTWFPKTLAFSLKNIKLKFMGEITCTWFAL